MNNCLKGKIGEKIAENFLKRKGYKILEKNFITKFGEIDIVAKKDEKIIFIEVKSMNINSLFNPEENFTTKKSIRIQKSIEVYLNKTKYFSNFRVDLIAIRIDFKKRIAKVKHFLGII